MQKEKKLIGKNFSSGLVGKLGLGATGFTMGFLGGKLIDSASLDFKPGIYKEFFIGLGMLGYAGTAVTIPIISREYIPDKLDCFINNTVSYGSLLAGIACSCLA